MAASGSAAGSGRRATRRGLARAAIVASVANVLASALGAPATGRAQPAPAAAPAVDAKAVTLFKEARALMERGRHAEACPKLEASFEIDPGMGTLYNLADCYEHIGRTASAWAGFRDVAAAADAAGQAPRAQAARERATAIEPRLTKIRVAVSREAAAAGVEVQRNGVVVGKILWGTDVPVDPGTYVISASAPGRAPWSATVPVEGAGQLVTVEVPPLAPLKQAPPSAPERPPPPPPPERSAVPVLLFAGLAAAGAAGGVALFIVSGSKEADAVRLRSQIPTDGTGQDNACLARPAPPACAELKSAATSAAMFRSLSYGGFALGGVGLVGMVTALLIPPSSPSAPPAGKSAGALGEVRVTSVLPTVGRSATGESGGLLVVGTF
jgi:serine/threonine-protein kinase